MNQLVNGPEGEDRSRETRSETSAPAQMVTGMSELGWDNGPGLGTVEEASSAWLRGSWQVLGPPLERETQGKGRVTHPLPLNA